MIEGQGCGQHGEDRILYMFFRDQEEGFIVDVGAADGWSNSNSFILLQRPGWKGVLIEPEPVQYQTLQERYKDNPNVECVNCAIGTETGMKTLYCGGQVSTFEEEKRKLAEIKYHVDFTPIDVQMISLTKLLVDLNTPKKIDFLSIDVEGMDYDVWKSLEKKIFSPKLIIIEGAGYAMEGYKYLCQIGCNTFYLKEELCFPL